MAIQNAIGFIQDCMENPELVTFFSSLNDKLIFPVLKAKGYNFSGWEFEEAVNVLHVKCQFVEQADALMHIKTWYLLLTANIYTDEY